MTFTELSRYRVHKAKVALHRSRIRLGKVNAVVERIEKEYGGREQALGSEAYSKWLIQRMKLMGELKGQEKVFIQFGISTNREDPPLVKEEDIYGPDPYAVESDEEEEQPAPKEGSKSKKAA